MATTSDAMTNTRTRKNNKAKNKANNLGMKMAERSKSKTDSAQIDDSSSLKAAQTKQMNSNPPQNAKAKKQFGLYTLDKSEIAEASATQEVTFKQSSMEEMSRM